MARVSFFTDLHLGVHQNSEKWFTIAEEWCEWYCENLKKHNVDTVIFLGDLFHYRDEISNKTLTVATKIIDTIAHNCTNMLMIPGNHDCYYKDNASVHSLAAFKKRSNVTVFDKPVLQDINGVKTLFCPWGTTPADIVPCDVICGHFDTVGFKMNNSKVSEHGFEPSLLASNAKYTFTGHYHTKSIKKVNGSIIHYIGNPFEMDLNDLNDVKMQYIFDFNNGITPVAAIKNTFSPQHKVIDINEAAAKPELLKNALVRLTIPQMDYNEIEAKLTIIKASGAVELQTTFVSPERAAVDAETATNSTVITMEDAITEYIESVVKDDAKTELLTYLLEVHNKCKN